MADLNIYLKDPAFPDLTKVVPVPAQNDSMPFDVMGFIPGLFDLGSNEGRAGNCYSTVAGGIADFLRIRNGSPISWARTARLQVKPMVGQMWNAFYDRKNLNFFFNWDGIRQFMSYASSSPNIVLHELGHAVLDSMRPDFWNYSTMFEVWALHEAFGDIFARAGAVAHDEVLTRALAETNNDLSKANLISGLAEQFGTAMTNTPVGQITALRDATQLFVYADPATLPRKGPASQLIQEVHSFSRIFSGMVYDFFVRLHKKNMATMDPFVAAKEAMNTTIHYVIATAQYVAVRPDFFDSYARCMLFIDFQAGQPHSKLLYEAFNARNIIHEVKALEVVPEPTGEFQSAGENTGRHLKVYKNRGSLVVSHQPGIRAMDFNPLYDLEVEFANDRHREFDQFGNLAIDDYANHQSAVDSVALTLDCLHREDLVGDKEHQPFGIDGSRLVRKHFAC